MIRNLIVNKDVGIIKTKPGNFIGESIVFAGATIVTTAISMFIRNSIQRTTKDYVYLYLGLLIGFITLNFVLEMSGFYTAAFSKETETKKPSKRKMNAVDKLVDNYNSTSGIFIMIVAGIILLQAVVSGLYVWDKTPSYNINWAKEGAGLWGLFSIETILFAVINAVPIYYIAFNRGALSAKTSKEFGMLIGKMALVHLLLQFSGFYSNFFNGKFKQ